MRQALKTKYHGPTNTRGSRVTAESWNERLTMPWNHALNADENHRAAAEALLKKIGWGGRWYGGAAPKAKGYVFVCADLTDPLHVSESKEPSNVEKAARALIAAYGGDVPDWLRAEVAALETALEG